MKTLKLLFIFVALMTVSCGVSKMSDSPIIILPNHKIIITEYKVGKYTQIKFKTIIHIEGAPIEFNGSNGYYGNFANEYNLKVGDTLVQEITLVQNGESFHIQELPFIEYMK